MTDQDRECQQNANPAQTVFHCCSSMISSGLYCFFGITPRKTHPVSGGSEGLQEYSPPFCRHFFSCTIFSSGEIQQLADFRDFPVFPIAAWLMQSIPYDYNRKGKRIWKDGPFRGTNPVYRG